MERCGGRRGGEWKVNCRRGNGSEVRRGGRRGGEWKVYCRRENGSGDRRGDRRGGRRGDIGGEEMWRIGEEVVIKGYGGSEDETDYRQFQINMIHSFKTC